MPRFFSYFSPVYILQMPRVKALWVTARKPASRIVADLREKGRIERGWLGVSVQDAPNVRGVGAGGTGGAGAGGGAIAGIDRAGPAARAGLRPGDIVLAVNGERVDNARGLIRAVAAVAPGNQVRLSVRRGGQASEVPVTVGRRPAENAG